LHEYMGPSPEFFPEDIVHEGLSLNATIPMGKEMVNREGLGKKIVAMPAEFQYTPIYEPAHIRFSNFRRGGEKKTTGAKGG
jgi:hypothetical protein